MALLRHNQSFSAKPLLYTCLLGWLSVSAVGCANSRLVQARRVPPQFIPPPVTSVETLDLTRFARPAVPNNLLQPGDIISVTIATGLEKEKPVAYDRRIAVNGACGVPLVGSVGVAGLELPAAERAIFEASVRRGIYRNPQVSIQLIKRKNHKVVVAGAVKNQGTYELAASSCDIVQAIIAAGGFSENADTIVEVRQTPGTIESAPIPGIRQVGLRAKDVPASFRIDLANAQNRLRDLRISDGATVYVRPRRLRAIYVIGLVNKVDRYDMPNNRDIRVLDAIAMAGGRTIQLADDVRIIRQVPGQSEPLVIQASVKEAKQIGAANVILAPGDVVSVEETTLTFTMTTLQSFFRFGFSSALPGF